MKNRLIALLLALCTTLPVLPLGVLAGGADGTSGKTVGGDVPGSKEEIVIRKADGETPYDEEWEELYPYGTFAFGDVGAELEEGASGEDGTLLIPVYRLGGTDGAATAIIRYSPNVFLVDEEKISYSMALSALTDVELSYESANPLAYYQKLASPAMVPSPEGLVVGVKPCEKEISGAFTPVTFYLYAREGQTPECRRYEWQYLRAGDTDRRWRTMESSNTAELSVDLFDILDAEGNALYDYRLIYETEDGLFCTPGFFGKTPYDPADSDAAALPEGEELLDNGGYLPLKADDPFDAFEFELTFADGEWIKYIQATVKNDDVYEPDEIGTFAITECIGGVTSSVSSSFTLTVKDDDYDRIEPSQIGFLADGLTVDQDAGCAELTVHRYGDCSYFASVHYETKDGTAVSGRQYAFLSGDLMFGPDCNTTVIRIPLIAEPYRSRPLSFTVELSGIRGGSGSCTLDEVSVSTVSLISGGKLLPLGVTRGGLGAGLNLATVLSAGVGNDASANLIKKESGLLGNADNNYNVTSGTETHALEAEYVKAFGLGVYDYSAVRFRRYDGYEQEATYWKDYEIPYDTDTASAPNDVMNYALSGAKFYKKGSFTPKSGGKATLSTNYDTTHGAALTIPDAGYLFTEVNWDFEVTNIGKCGQFLGIGYNYVMPWVHVNFADTKNYYNFEPQDSKSNPLKKKSYANSMDLAMHGGDFFIDMNMTLNDAGERSTKHEDFTYVPDSSTVLELQKLSFRRRVLTGTDELSLRIYTSNDSDAGGPAVLDPIVYAQLKPDVSLVSRSSGVTTGGDLYVGSQICVTLPSVASFKPYDGKTASDSVYLTTTEGRKVDAKVERAGEGVYFITLLWDNMTEADLTAHYRVNVVYERRQNVKLDITPSLQRDEKGNVMVDADSLRKSWEKVFKAGGKDTVVTLTYSKRDETAENGYTLTTVQKKLSELIRSTAASGYTIAPGETGITNLQDINFGLSAGDILLFNGEQYYGDETISLAGSELTAETLSFTYYNADCLEMENIMEATVSHTELYFDGNGNGRIDGYYDEASGLFVVDPESGDEYLGLAEGNLMQSRLTPEVGSDGNIRQYFLKVYYSMTPRSLRKGEDTAQVLPAFVPQNTDKATLSKLTYEQGSYRLIRAGATTVVPYDKKTGTGGTPYELEDSSEGHPMYGAEATRQSTLDIPLGGDMTTYRSMTVIADGKETTTDLPSYYGNLRVDFVSPETILVDTPEGTTEEVDDANAFLGAFIMNTTFVLGVQETRSIRTQQDFKPESIANGNCVAIPAENVSSRLNGKDGTNTLANAGSDDNDVTSMADYNTLLSIPSTSVGLLGVNATMWSDNTMYLSFGFPIAAVEHNLSYQTKQTQKDIDGTTETITTTNSDGSQTTEVKEYGPASEDNPEGEYHGSVKTTEYESKDCSSKTGKTVYHYDEKTTYTETTAPDGTKTYEKVVERTNRWHLDEKGKRVNDSDEKIITDEQREGKTFHSSFGGFSDRMSSALNLDSLIALVNGDSKFEKPDKSEVMKNPTACKISLSLSLKFLVTLQYNKLDGGWHPTSFYGSLFGVFSIEFKHRLLANPLFYFFINFSLSATAKFNMGIHKAYGDTYTLGKGDTLSFPIPSDGKNVTGFRGWMNGEAGVSVYADPDHKTLLASGKWSTAEYGMQSFTLDPYQSGERYVVLTALGDETYVSDLSAIVQSHDPVSVDPSVIECSSFTSETLEQGQYLQFTIDRERSGASGFSMEMNGKTAMLVYSDPSCSDDSVLTKGVLHSDGEDTTTVNLSKYKDTLYVRLYYYDSPVTVDNLRLMHDEGYDTSYDGFDLYLEMLFEIGMGVGIDLLKAELFGKADAAITVGYDDEIYVKDFYVDGSLTLRAKFILFDFSVDLVGVRYTGARASSDESFDTHLYFNYLWGSKELDTLLTAADEYKGVHVDAPTSSRSTQSFYDAYNEGGATENAYHPTDPEVKFEISGYANGGDAFKLADHLNGGYSYKGINLDGETYLLYLISDPDQKTGINASRLVLSKVVTNGDHPGIVHPFDLSAARPYLEVSSALSGEETGDLEYSYQLDGTVLTVTYTCYDTHFDASAVPEVGEAGRHIVVRRTSVDLAGGTDETFSEPVPISGEAGVYRFLPVMGGGVTVYGETLSDAGNAARDARLRQYLKSAYGLTDEELNSGKTTADKSQYLYRYTTGSALRGLTGDGTALVAVTADGTIVSVSVGSRDGEILTSSAAEKYDGETVVFYTTEQELFFAPDGKTVTELSAIDETTDCATVTRLYVRTFDGSAWGNATLLTSAVNFEHCTSSSSGDSLLRDGFYSGGSLVEAFIDPTLGGLRFLSADLDGTGIQQIFTFEMGENTYLLDENSLLALLAGEETELLPIFGADTGSGVTIASDKNGNLAMAYLKTVPGSDSNAIYLAWWDKTLGTWGEGTMLAMNHMSVYENAVKYGLAADEIKHAFLGEPTGNVEYDAYTAGENSEKGAYDRFVFSSLQLLPSTVETQYGDGTNDVREQLILLSNGVFSTLAKSSSELGGKDVEYYYEDENFGNGFYAIAFGSGEQGLGNASLSLDRYDFSAGSSLSGTVSFTNTGSSAIRGSVDQPISVLLLAQNDEEGFRQTVCEWEIGGMIGSGASVELDFVSYPLQADLPAGTTLRLLVSEDASYIEQSGGTAFGGETEPLLTVKQGAELGIEELHYELLSMDEETVLIGTEFLVVNRGTEQAQNLFVQYTAMNGEEKVALDIEGSVLRVSNEKVLTEMTNGITVSDLGIGVVALEDENGENTLSAGYYRSVTGALCIRREDFSRFEKEGLRLCITLFSDEDSYLVSDSVYEATDSKEYGRANNTQTRMIRHRTDFSVPSFLSTSIENTLRVPVGFTSSCTENEIVVREISNGTEGWSALFSDVYYDVSHNAVVAVASQTGHTVLQIEDRSTNSFREIAVEVTNSGVGVNIYSDDDSFDFRNPDGSEVQEAGPGQGWEFRSGVSGWNGEDMAPMRNDYAVATKANAYVSFKTVSTTLTVYYSGSIEVSSDLDRFTAVTGSNAGKTGEPLTVRFDNLDGKQHTVTIRALSENTQIDRYTAAYPEETGQVKKTDPTAPDFLWARSFPNTASILNGGRVAIDCYVIDALGVVSVTADGEELALEGAGTRLAKFTFTFTENGNYTFIATDTDGNRTVHTLAVHWFGELLNRDAVRTAPDFDDSYVRILGEDGKAPRTKTDRLYLASSYHVDEKDGEQIHAYYGGNTLPETELSPASPSYASYTFPDSFRVTGNGFYALRVVAENGTWSRAVFDVTLLKTADTLITVTLSEEGDAVNVSYDAAQTGVVPLTILWNGAELLPRPENLKGTYTLPLSAGGTYQVVLYNGTDTYTATFDLERSLSVPERAILRFDPDPNDAPNGELHIDVSAIAGGKYDKALSDPANGVYKAKYEFALLPGRESERMKAGTGITWTSEPIFQDLSVNYYTVGIRDANNPSDVYVKELVLGTIPPLSGKLVIEGEPTRGTTLKAVITDGRTPIGTLSYQWFRYKDGKKTPIENATGETYTVTANDYFSAIGCTVTSSFETGSLETKTTAEATVGSSGWDGVYDGRSHSFSIDSTGRSDVMISYTIRDKVPGTKPSYTNVGTYTASFYLIENPPHYVLPTYRYYGYYVKTTQTITIRAKDITGATVTLDEPYYNGSMQTCTVRSVKIDGLDATFEVTGNTATEIGDYTMTIKGTGNFTGEIEVAWSMKPIDLSKVPLKYTFDRTPTYDGTEQTVSLTSLKANGLDADYTVTGGTTGTNAGTYYLTVKGSGIFTGEAKIPWKIEPKDITGAVVTLQKEPLTYNTKQQTMKVLSVELDGKPITEYTVSDNSRVSAGKYTMSIRGTGNYKGTVSVPWSIAPYHVTDNYEVIRSPLIYNGKEQTLYFSQINIAAETPFSMMNYDITDRKATDAGEYTAHVVLRGNCEGEFDYKWTIEPKDISGAKIELASKALQHTGSPLEMEVLSVVIDGIVVDDYEVSGNVETEIGDYTLTVTGKGNFKGTATATWHITAFGFTGGNSSLTVMVEDPAYIGRTLLVQGVSFDYIRKATIGEDGIAKITRMPAGTYTVSVMDESGETVLPETTLQFTLEENKEIELVVLQGEPEDESSSLQSIPERETTSGEKEPQGGNRTLLFVLIGILAAVLLGVLIALLVRKKKYPYGN